MDISNKKLYKIIWGELTFKRSVIGSLILVVVFLFLLFSSYKIYDVYFSEHLSTNPPFAANETITDEIYDGIVIKQEIDFKGLKKIGGISLKFGTYNRENDGLLLTKIFDESNNLIMNNKINLSELNDNSYHSFYFDKWGNYKKLTIVLTTNADKTNAITLYKNDSADIKGRLLVNNAEKTGNISFSCLVSNNMPFEHFLIIFLIIFIPFFILLGFKLKIWSNSWENINKPILVDYLLFSLIIIFCYLSFNHGDIAATSVHGKDLIDVILKNNFLSFYEYTEGTAVYLIPTYIVFALWSIPVKIIYSLTNIPLFGHLDFNAILFNYKLLMWYKLLPTLFYLASAYVLYKIGLQVKLSKNTSKLLSFIWLIQPIAVFSQFVFGQYDSLNMFFILLMVLYFLKKDLWKFSLFALISITFKITAIFIFLPMLLLLEKRIIHIIKYLLTSLSGYVICIFAFRNSLVFTNASGTFNRGMTDRLFTSGFQNYNGTIAFFVACIVLSCVFTYIINIKHDDDFVFYKIATYIPLFIYSMFFSFVLFHPQWVLLLTPFLLITIFLNDNLKISLSILTILSISWLINIGCNWIKNVDANLVNFGIFSKIFKWQNSFVDPAKIYHSLNTIFTLNGKFQTSSATFTIFVSLLFVILILTFPSKKNIERNINTYCKELYIEHEVVWINGFAILTFIVPSIYLFFI